MHRERSVSQSPYKGIPVTFLPSTKPLLNVPPSFKGAGGHNAAASPAGPQPGLSSHTGLSCSWVHSSKIWSVIFFQGWAIGQPGNITSSPSSNTNPDLHASAANMYSLCNLFILYTDRLRINETSFQTGRRKGRKKETSKWMKEQRKEGIMHNAKCLKSKNSLRVSGLLPLAS